MSQKKSSKTSRQCYELSLQIIRLLALDGIKRRYKVNQSIVTNVLMFIKTPSKVFIIVDTWGHQMIQGETNFLPVTQTYSSNKGRVSSRY